MSGRMVMLNAGTLHSMECRRGRVCILSAGVVHYMGRKFVAAGLTNCKG